MVKDTIEVSDGRHYKLKITAVRDPEPEYRWGVHITATATNFESPDLEFEAMYVHKFCENNQMDENNVIEDTRTAVVIFFEGSAQDWSIYRSKPFHYWMYRS